MNDISYKKVIGALFIGLCVGIFCGSTYGWLNIKSNADTLRGINCSLEWADVRISRKFCHLVGISPWLLCSI